MSAAGALPAGRNANDEVNESPRGPLHAAAAARSPVAR
jgi:hypothetical protein